jgi:hypothetical protein
MFAKSVAANFFTDLSPYAGEGDIFHVPGVFTNAFTPGTQSTQGAEVTTESVAMDDTTLTVSTHRYIATIIGDLQQAQLKKSYDLNAIYARKTGGTLSTLLEASLFGLWSGLSTNSSGDTATVLSDAEVRLAIEKLAAGNFDTRECAWFVHPYTYWLQLAAISKYYDLSQSGIKFIQSGNFGSMDASRGLVGGLYGIPMYTSTNVVSGLQTYRNLLAHKSAFGFALQTPGGSKVRVQAENSIRNLGLLTVSDIIYGVAELRDAAAVVVNSSTSFIGS